MSTANVEHHIEVLRKNQIMGECKVKIENPNEKPNTFNLGSDASGVRGCPGVRGAKAGGR